MAISLSRNPWIIPIFDFISVSIIWLIAIKIRIGEVRGDIFLSNRYFLLVGSVLISTYLLDSLKISIYHNAIRIFTRFTLSCFLAAGIITIVYYVEALGWTGGGQGLYGRGILLPTFIIFGFFGGLYRFLFFKLIKRSSINYNWLIIGDEQFDHKSFSDKIKSIYHEIDFTKSILVADIDRKRWDGIVIIDEDSLTSEHMDHLMQSRLNGTLIYTISEIYEEMLQKVPLEHLNHRWFATVGGFRLLHQPINRKMKRLLDITLSATLLILSAPIYISAIIIIIIVGGPGGIIYKQKRIGQNGNLFTIYKFRTMKNNSEIFGAQWATKNDARVYPLGNYLRKFRIDELPQLWNIIKGDMSFIGPRPERPEFAKELEENIAFFSLRLLIKPGLTGWAQINYPYGANEQDAKEKLGYDLFYIKNQNIILDFIITIRTIKVVLWGFGGI